VSATCEGRDGFDGRDFAATLPRRPGVYRMFAADESLLYVGKAKSLRDRVGSYFNPGNVHPKVQLLVGLIARMEVTVTRSETEALLLEYNLIKELKPRYNVVLRDDKSFPYIHLTAGHAFPRLMLYRGSRSAPGRYFGPYPSPGAVYETLHFLQKTFRIRNCRDSYFAHRSRPCLQHQIGRCSAPCVGLISAEAYAADVAAAVGVLEGRENDVVRGLGRQMEAAAERLEFEHAAELRDRIAAINEVQAQQIVAAEGERDVDVFALRGDPGGYAISVMRVRGGRSLGTQTSCPRAALAEPAEALGSFVLQYYSGQDVPAEVFLSLELPDLDAHAEALSQLAGHRVELRVPQRGIGARWVELTQENAAQALRMREAQRQGVEAQYAALADELGLAELPARLECFDISHTGGEGTVAACVVFGPEGPLKKEYRRFNISGVAPGDDYGAMAQALRRRYARVQAGEVPRPDVLLIDGGAQQVAAVVAVLRELGLDEQLVVGVAKGADRRPGQERLHLPDESAPRIPGPESSALRLIQRIRDEAHRFAVAGHRRRRARRFNESILETVPGLGPAKRRALLRHFGGLQGILRAGVPDLEQVQGIGPAMARTVYDHLHPGE
jgi:excinuclease ABC subunit C